MDIYNNEDGEPQEYKPSKADLKMLALLAFEFDTGRLVLHRSEPPFALFTDIPYEFMVWEGHIDVWDSRDEQPRPVQRGLTLEEAIDFVEMKNEANMGWHEDEDEDEPEGATFVLKAVWSLEGI